MKIPRMYGTPKTVDQAIKNAFMEYCGSIERVDRAMILLIGEHVRELLANKCNSKNPDTHAEMKRMYDDLFQPDDIEKTRVRFLK